MMEVIASSFQVTPLMPTRHSRLKEQCDSSGGVNESETDNRKRERKAITSGGGSGLSGLIFLSTRIRQRKAAIAVRSRKEEIGGSE
jgi:hypothetical protein